MKFFKHAHGLTLIEIIAAVGILAVGLVGILSLFPIGLRHARESTNISRATVLGQSVIEEIRQAVAEGKDITWLRNNYQIPKQDLPEDNRFQYSVTINYAYINDEIPTSGNIVTPPPGFHKVVVTMYWPPTATKQQQRMFITYIRPQ